MPVTSQEVRDLIVFNRFTNQMSYKEIAKVFRVSMSTARSICLRYETTGSSAPLRRHNARRRSLSPVVERQLKRRSLANPRLTARQLQQATGGQASTVSLTTIRRSLRRSGLFCYRPVRAPQLSKTRISKRHQWAQTYAKWKAPQWTRVIFSDETAIQYGIGNQSPYVRRGRGAPITMAHANQRRGSSRTMVWFWGCITSAGPGPLVPLAGAMTARRYEVVLEEYLLPIYDASKIFQHDNAPCHKAQSISTFMEQSNIQVLPWPPYSPDMNPIENLWSILKRKLNTEACRTKSQLIDKAQEIWQNDEEIKRTINTMYAGMPRRIGKLRTQKGGVTGY